jgi:hypothetical protein
MAISSLSLDTRSRHTSLLTLTLAPDVGLPVTLVVLLQPETVPQASIDMNKVLEVTDGEEVTGHAFSLAITAPDRVHFVKGTCREECRWWGDVLSVFPRSKVSPTFTCHVLLCNTPIHNILSTSQLSISQKSLGTLPEDGNVMPKLVGATLHN